MMLRWLTLLLFITMPAIAAAQDRLVIGTQLSAKNAAIFLGAARGYFKAEGIELDMRGYTDDTQLLNSLASGQLDLATSDLSAAVFKIAGAGKIKMIAAQARENPDFEGNQVVASVPAYNRGLRTWNDLAGRTIAVNELGSVLHYQIGQISGAKKFDLRNVSIKQFRTLEAVSAAITDDKADAAVLPVQYARDLLMAGQARLLGSMAEIDQQQLGALFASNRSIADRRRLLERFLGVYRRSAAEYTAAMFRRDRFSKRMSDKRAREVAGQVARYIFPKLPAERGTIAVEGSAYYLDPQAKLDTADLARQIAWFKSQGLLDASVEAGSIVDASFSSGLK